MSRSADSFTTQDISQVLEDSNASIRIEEMDLVAIDIELYFIANTHTRAMIERGYTSLIGGSEVDLQLITQILYHVNRRIDSRTTAVAAHQGRILKVRRANTK